MPSSTTPRACPSFSVLCGLLLTNTSSTAAASGLYSSSRSVSSRSSFSSRLANGIFGSVFNLPIGDMGQPVAIGTDHAPAGGAETGVKAEDDQSSMRASSGDGQAQAADCGVRRCVASEPQSLSASAVPWLPKASLQGGKSSSSAFSFSSNLV